MKGSEFKSIREGLGLSQDELAAVLCLSSKQAVSNIETGFRNPSKLSAVLMRVFADLSKSRFKELSGLMLELGSDIHGGKKRGR